ncbi:MAG: hypothetical protein RLZZ440_2149 [Planctomycetota bacterium]
MDSEQTAPLGELHDNDLAVTSQAIFDRIRPHLSTLLLVAAVVFLGMAGWTLLRSQRVAEQRAAWDGFINAFAEGDAGALDTVMARFGGSPAAQWAAIVQADAALADGNRLLLTDPAQARKRLEAAVERYAAVNAERPSDLAAQRAVFGLARARESLGELEEAARGYQTLVAEYPESGYVAVAEERIAALSRPATREWYNWFESRPAAGAASAPAAESSDAPAQPAADAAAPAG